tara:strand:+ start:213 stop:434 length:222 start_codon:yes stop_codon:yes gene_type:complete
MKKIYNSIKSSRKLQMFILMYITSTILYVWVGNVEFSEWKDLMVWCFGIYCGGNVGEHYSKSVNGNENENGNG